GRPAPNSITCGRPNVFQGKTDPANPGFIRFSGIPMDPPGTTTSRTFRITNIRVDSTSVSSGLYSSAQIIAQIYVNATTSIAITNPQQVLAYIAPGMTAAVTGNQ